MASVMISLKLKIMQRPAAVCNCTIEEYRRATVQDDVTIIKVKDHKIASTSGSAKLTSNPSLTCRLHK